MTQCTSQDKEVSPGPTVGDPKRRGVVTRGRTVLDIDQPTLYEVNLVNAPRLEIEFSKA
jgi:hypothetical protein